MHCKYINWQKGKWDDVLLIGMTDVLSTAFSYGLGQFGHPSPLSSPPPSPSSIFFSYLLKIPAFPGVKFHFWLLYQVLYFCVQEPMTYMHWFLEEQLQDFRLSLADEYSNGDEYVSQKKKQESTTSTLINKSIH